MNTLVRNVFLGPLAEIGAKCRESDCKRIVLVSDRTVIGLHGDAVRKSLAVKASDSLRCLTPLSPPLERGEARTETAKSEILRFAQNDDEAAGKCPSTLQVDEFIIEPGEASKSLESSGAMYQFLADRCVERDAMILAVGGGVVSDLAGFVAATWMRGIRWAICPTTLEAQIDAAIGGKTAINIPGGKNLVGAFHEPDFVWIDPATLATLPDRDFRAGLAESVKHALITSEEFFAWHESHCETILSRNSSILDEMIRRNVQIKSDIVASDPRERTGARMVLNFGHTIGHAIEECSGYSLRHGECVSLGMIAACRLSYSLGLAGARLADRATNLLLRFGLPTTLTTPIPVDQILAAVRKDKKNRSGGLRLVLVEGIGRPMVREDIGNAVIIETYGSLVGYT